MHYGSRSHFNMLTINCRPSEIFGFGLFDIAGAAGSRLTTSQEFFQLYLHPTEIHKQNRLQKEQVLWELNSLAIFTSAHVQKFL
jgi:hypothetical protein